MSVALHDVALLLHAFALFYAAYRGSLPGSSGESGRNCRPDREGGW
jgi:hypothetical protein